VTRAAPSSVALDAWLAKAGPAAESFARIWQRLWGQDRIPPALLELCRLNLARLHDDAIERAAANPNLSEGAVGAERRRAVLDGEVLGDPAFSAAEQSVLLFTEYYWGDAQSIPDEAAAAVVTHFGEPGLVLLIEALGCIDGRIRAARCLRDLESARGVAHAG
jgi:hypothetical protein